MSSEKMKEIEATIDQLIGLNSRNKSIQRLIGELEDKYAQAQGEFYQAKMREIVGACPWAKDEVINAYVMEWAFDPACSAEHFKKSLLG